MLNKKGFVLLETIIVMSVLLIGMILLYSNYNKLFINYGKISYSDNVKDIYTAYYAYQKRENIGFNNGDIESIIVNNLTNEFNEILNNLDIEKIYYFKKDAFNNIFINQNGNCSNLNKLICYDGTSINYLKSIENKTDINKCVDNDVCLTVVKIKRNGYYYFAKYEAYNM